MTRNLLITFCGIFMAAGALGCTTSDMSRRVDALRTEKENVLRQRAAIEAELLTCRARCESLEAELRQKPKAGVTPTPFQIPVNLQGKVGIRRRGSDTIIDIPSDLFFSSGSSKLTSQSRKTMGHVVSFIKGESQGGMIRVEGHTDSDPIRRSKSRYHCNWELSFERSHSVMHYLLESGGFDPGMIVCESYGQHQPVDSKNKSRNRRVEIVVARK